MDRVSQSRRGGQRTGVLLDSAEAETEKDESKQLASQRRESNDNRRKEGAPILTGTV